MFVADIDTYPFENFKCYVTCMHVLWLKIKIFYFYFYFLGVYLCFACEFWFGFMGVIWGLGDSCWVGVGPLIRCP